MSYFGDDTPAQEILDTATRIAREYRFTDEDMQIILHKVEEFFYAHSVDFWFENINHRNTEK